MSLLAAAEFEMVELVDRDVLARHPAWATWGDPGDRELLLGSGVKPEQLDRALAAWDDCGPSLLFPAPIEGGRLPPKSGLVVAARMTAASGHTLQGWVIEPNAFGVFAGDDELAFNRTLPRGAAERAATLAAGVGSSVDSLFPLDFHTGLLRADGTSLEGRIEVFW